MHKRLVLVALLASAAATLGWLRQSPAGAVTRSPQPGVIYTRLRQVAMAPDARWIAAALDGGTVTVFRPDTGRDGPGAGALLDTAVATFAVSADGRMLGAVTTSGAWKVWEVTTPADGGVALRAIEVDSISAVRAGAMAFSPDGRLLALADEKQVHVRELSTWKRIDLSEARLNNTSDVAFSPDGRLLSATNADGVFVWDVATWRRLGRFRPGRASTSFASSWFTGDGRLAMHAVQTGTLFLWDLATGREVASRQVLKPNTYDGFAFNRDGARLAVVAGDTVEIRDTESGDVLQRLAPLPGVFTSGLQTTLNLSEDGHTLLLANPDAGVVGLWSLAGAQPSAWWPLAVVRTSVDSVTHVATEPAGYRRLPRDSGTGPYLLVHASLTNLIQRPQRVGYAHLNLNATPQTVNALDVIWEDKARLLAMLAGAKEAKIRGAVTVDATLKQALRVSVSDYGTFTDQQVWLLPGMQAPLTFVFRLPPDLQLGDAPAIKVVLIRPNGTRLGQAPVGAPLTPSR